MDLEANNRNMNTQENIDDNFIVPEKLTSKDWTAQIRLGFIRKVYGIICMQLLITIIICVISMTNDKFANFQRTNLPLMISVVVLLIILMIILLCFKKASRKVPFNYILLFLFTFCESYLVSALCADTEPKIVLMAALLTAAITISLTIYACVAKTDITYAGGAIFIISISLIACLILCLIMPNRFLIIIILCLFVILYGFYLIYDTKLVVGGGRYELGIDDYIIGALVIYLDIILLFIRILQILRLAR